MSTAVFISIVMLSVVASGFELIGTAKDIKSGKIIYIEKHQITNDAKGFNRLIQTDYTRPNGEIFASIKSDFSKSLFLPEVEYKDQRFQLTETQTYDKESQKVVLTKIEKNKEAEKKEFAVKDNFVTGQGFNNFIKTHFEALPGKAIEINFIVLARMDYYKFNILPQKIESTTERSFALTAGNFIFRMFSHPIEVSYDARTCRLLTFKGLSNIMNDQDKSQEVLIHYSEGTP